MGRGSKGTEGAATGVLAILARTPNAACISSISLLLNDPGVRGRCCLGSDLISLYGMLVLHNKN
jgi:hypothetical protein